LQSLLLLGAPPFQSPSGVESRSLGRQMRAVELGECVLEGQKSTPGYSRGSCDPWIFTFSDLNLLKSEQKRKRKTTRNDVLSCSQCLKKHANFPETGTRHEKKTIFWSPQENGPDSGKAKGAHLVIV